MSDLAKAEECKNTGNEMFKKGKLDAAIEAYGEAIMFAPSEPVYYTNRAMCFRKKEHWERVTSDCHEALKLDDTTIKGHYLLGVALDAMQQHAEQRLAQELRTAAAAAAASVDDGSATAAHAAAAAAKLGHGWAARHRNAPPSSDGAHAATRLLRAQLASWVEAASDDVSLDDVEARQALASLVREATQALD